jgi:hypothetical protein
MTMISAFLNVFTTQEHTLYYVEGKGDMILGRDYSGAFLPFDGNADSPYGLYYIIGRRFFYRAVEGKQDVTRLLSVADEKKIRERLIDIVEKVISTKGTVVCPATPKPVKEEKIAVKVEKKVKEQPKTRVEFKSERFMVLTGWNGKKHDSRNHNSDFLHPRSTLQPGDVNFTYRNK